MIEAAAKVIAEGLASRGIDASSFLADGVEAAKTVAGGDETRAVEVLGLLEHFAHQLEAKEIALWTPFHFAVAPIARVASQDHLQFAALLSEVWALIEAMSDRGLSSELCLQQGVATAANAEHAGEILGRLLRLGARLAARGINPKEILRHGPTIAIGEDGREIGARLDALESFVIAMHELGVGPYFPIMTGVAAIAESTATEAYAFVDAMRDLASTIASMVIAGQSPYPVVEYGVTAAFRCVAQAPWLSTEILPLAGAIAAHGNSPLPALARGLPAIAWFEELVALPVLLAVEQAAEEGLDPAPVLHSFVPVLHGSDADTIAELTAEACALLRTMSAHGIKPMLVFDEGFSQLQGRSAEMVARTLRLARAIADSGMDPGPAIKYGVVSTIARFETEPAVLEAILDTAEKQAIDAIDPWALLQWGTELIAAAPGDEAERLDLLIRIDALVRALAELGADVRSILLFTVWQPARSLGHDRTKVLALIERTAGAIAALSRAGIDPRDTMVRGIPAVADEASHALEQAFRLIDALASRRIDPAPMLSEALPALAATDALDALIDQLLAAIDAAPKNASHVADTVAAIGGDRAFVLMRSLALIADFSARGRNAAPMLAAMVPELSAADEPEFQRMLAVIEEVFAELGDVEARAGLSYVARAANGRATALADVLSSWRRWAEALLFSRKKEPSCSWVLEWGALAAEIAGGGEPLRFDRTLDRFVRAVLVRASPAHAEGAEDLGQEVRQALAEKRASLEAVLRASLRSIAELSEHDADVFGTLLDALFALADSPGAPLDALLEHALPVARRSAEGRADAYREALQELSRIRTSGAIARVEGNVWHAVGLLASLVEREPRAFRELIVPTIRSQGAGAPVALAGYRRLARFIDGDAIALLRTLATQEGVRAPELVHGFLFEGLTSGAIRSLGGEQEQILAFLREVPIAHPEYYRRYVKIACDETRSVAEKRAAIEALSTDVRALVQAIVKGELTDAIAGDPLFADALYYVFPPAYSVQRRAYESLVRSFADHPEHVAAFPPIDDARVELSTGGYFLKGSVDLSPWQRLLDAVIAEHVGNAPPPELGELGGALLDAWIAGKIGQAGTAIEMLRLIYRRHRATGSALPEDLGDASSLLAHREFLADTAKEIIQDALRAVRLADPDRYAEQVRAKLSRRARVGTGLVRSVWRTIAAHREGTIDAETAIERLTRQLSGFDLSSERVKLRLLAVDREELQSMLEGLERSVEDVALGEEHLRVLGDLAGAELAAMQRELEGKLEYRETEGGRTISLRFEITKRKVHAPIGYCEGVCTAPDEQLWDDPRFLQTIFWGEDDRARGGMHLLVIEIDGERWLSLPGINPSLSLIAEIGAAPLLDAIFDFARRVAERWSLKGVLVPTHRGIATNRGPIWEALDARGLEERAIPPIQFSYRPYAYTFDRVLAVL